MREMTDEQFASLIARAMDEMPAKYMRGLDNIVITYADEPTAEQREKLRLRGHQSLFGLYEGIPLTQRGAGYNLVLPDKITIFKFPALTAAHDDESLYRQIKHTLWHEIAHFYGLNHREIHAIESRWEG